MERSPNASKPTCGCDAYPFPHRPGGGACGESGGWLTYAFEHGTKCEGCPFLLTWRENHGMPGGLFETFHDCSLGEERKPEVESCRFFDASNKGA